MNNRCFLNNKSIEFELPIAILRGIFSFAYILRKLKKNSFLIFSTPICTWNSIVWYSTRWDSVWVLKILDCIWNNSDGESKDSNAFQTYRMRFEIIRFQRLRCENFVHTDKWNHLSVKYVFLSGLLETLDVYIYGNKTYK